jgi:membrane associated rhomboid family serine protease
VIPIRDVLPSRTRPWVTLALLVAMAAVAVRQAALPPDRAAEFVYRWGVSPGAFSVSAGFWSMFVHAGWLHALANGVGLWLLGGTVEDRLGHARFLAFFLLAGVAAAAGEALASPGSGLPVVGATGAVAGVTGAYLALFPRGRVYLLVPVLWSIDLVEIPALGWFAVWLFLQLIGGVGRVVDGDVSGAAGAWALLTGLALGAASARWLARRERLRVEWWSP